ncbi:hypothetical protein BGZ73_009165 [Actinomortierella ambigua]|nr:hypothetical protein BGZ73_009165 [Actinomortierella ambigua]
MTHIAILRSDPETLRGFIRVFCQVALSGLQGLLLPALSNTVPATAEPCTQMMWIQVFDTWMEHITGFCCHRDWVAASQTLLGLHRFYGANSNIGKIFNTSDGNAPVDAGQLFWKAAFHLFGDDDADVTWLLHTTLDLTRKLESVVTQFRSSAALPQSLRVSGMTLYRLVELLIFVREGKPFSPTVENFLTTTTTTTAATVTAKHHIVFWGIQALDGYFFFLQTIGHDPQTVVDMLLSMDHQELGGFLAVTVSLIRYYLSSSSPSSSPEDLSNRERLLDRWNRMTVDAKLRLRGVHDEDAMAESEGADIEEEKDDEEDECDWTTTLARSHFCLHEVLTKLQALGRQGLLPFNPQVLICILDEFTDLIDKFLMPSAEQ